MPPIDPLAVLRRHALALPSAHEQLAWGEPTFRVNNKLFAMYASPANHHGRGRPAVWIKAKPQNQQLLIADNPARFFVPPYVGPSGWIGVWLDKRPSWTVIADLLLDGFRQVAPKRLLAQMADTA
jgi:hypothetical protein